jgi:hypothetical protein
MTTILRIIEPMTAAISPCHHWRPMVISVAPRLYEPGEKVCVR